MSARTNGIANSIELSSFPLQTFEEQSVQETQVNEVALAVLQNTESYSEAVRQNLEEVRESCCDVATCFCFSIPTIMCISILIANGVIIAQNREYSF